MDLPDRRWMYCTPRMIRGNVNVEFYNELVLFVEFAKSQPHYMSGNCIRCPCNAKKCQNKQYKEIDEVLVHIVKNGFVDNYYNWTSHGETRWPYRFDEVFYYYTTGIYQLEANFDHVGTSNEVEQRFGDEEQQFGDEEQQFGDEEQQFGDEEPNMYQTMIREAGFSNMEEEPTNEAFRFYEMLKLVEEDLYPGCESHSQLSFNARLMNIKTENKLSNRAYEQVTQLCSEICPQNNKVPTTFHQSKQMLKNVGLPVEKIDCCVKGCMLYWGDEDSSLNMCRLCGHPRRRRLLPHPNLCIHLLPPLLLPPSSPFTRNK